MADELAAEIAEEHHDRITEAEHEAEAASMVAVAAASEAVNVRSELDKYALVGHHHEENVTKEELPGLIEEHIGRRLAEQQAAAEEAANQQETMVETGPEVDELPLPEPEPEPEVRWERRHGRYSQRRAS